MALLRRMAARRRAAQGGLPSGGQRNGYRGEMPTFDASSPTTDPARYLRLAYWVAHALAPLAVHCDVDDLAQCALEAAVVYAPRHDGSRGAVSSYLLPCMVGSCLKELNRSKRLAHFGGSRYVPGPFRRLSRADGPGAAWSAAEARLVSGLVGLGDEEVMRAVAWCRSREEGLADGWRPEEPESFRDLLVEQVPEVIADQLVDEDAVHAMESAWDRHAVQKLLDGMRDLPRMAPIRMDVLVRRSFSPEQETLASIGARYGLSGERIRGIESEARWILLDAVGRGLNLPELCSRPKPPDPPRPRIAWSAPPSVGMLRLRVRTAGCEVRLNGVLFRPGVTWERWSATEMIPGYYWFSFSCRGYATTYKLVLVRAGQATSLSVKLKLAKGPP